MKFIYNDGGREAAGYKGNAGDCTVRAIAIATDQPYKQVYDDLFEMNRQDVSTNKKRVYAKMGKRIDCSPRNGNTKTSTTTKYLARFGWTWTSTMGTGYRVHMRTDELPPGRIIVRLSRHLAAVIDGVLHDTHNCTRGGTRCVYGYWTKE